jgi:hypothetical protein
MKAETLVPPTRPISQDLVGKTITDLTVIRFAGIHIKPSGKKNAIWECLCVCGSTILCRRDSLMTEKGTKSCGCTKGSRGGQIRTRHGFAAGDRHPFYRKWESMKSRCYDPKQRSYKYYGGVGVLVCEEWHAFEQFKEDMFPLWQDGLSLERKNPFLGYSKDNCCWIAWPDQWNNLRKSIFAFWDGKIQTIGQWAKEFKWTHCKTKVFLKNHIVARPL